jgi:hypothetical protein
MTTGTLDLMTAIFRLDRFDFRDLEDLVADGAGSLPTYILVQGQRAFLALIGIEVMDMVHFFDGEEFTVLSLMANLPAGPSSTRRTFLSAHLGTIRRWWEIGVLRILPQSPFQFFNTLR